jgi:Domain of unknown function (DUF6933)
VVLFISERSRLSVMIPVQKANRLHIVFPDAVTHAATAYGVPTDAVEAERLQMSKITFKEMNAP